jgi:hypothetical protein
MSGWQTLRQIQRLQEQAELWGFQLAAPQHHYGNEDLISLQPRLDRLSCWSRDAQLFTGTLAQAEQWLAGWARALHYLQMIGAADAKRIDRYDQRHRDYLADLERQREQAELVKVLKRPEPTG